MRGTELLTVALIGPDGSGKTSIAKQLVESLPVPIKYLYMGVSIESSNIALPTSRLAHHLKVRRYKRSLKREGQVVPENVTLHDVKHRVDRRGKLGATARLLSRIAEESFRQLVSWTYSIRGYVVLYDRHFLFDICAPPSSAADRRLTDRIHQWFLRRVYPKPSLVIFLDAPPEVLYARKQEVPEDYLQRDREALLANRQYAKHFIRVDATQPLDQVVAVVTDIIMQHHREARGLTPPAANT